MRGCLFLTDLFIVVSFALSAQDGKQAKSEPKKLTNSIGMKLVLIPAGQFVMGSPENEPERGDDETTHKVKITRSFFIGAYEVTQEQYEKIMGKNPSFFAANGKGKERLEDKDTSNLPVDQVTWHQAAQFCKNLSELPAEKKLDRTYRLPTEAEWEYACRAGSKSATAYGRSLNGYQANFCGLAPYPIKGKRGPDIGLTRPGGAYDANAFGLYDMHGNLHEWVADWYGPYETKDVQVDPQGPRPVSSRCFAAAAG